MDQEKEVLSISLSKAKSNHKSFDDSFNKFLDRKLLQIKLATEDADNYQESGFLDVTNPGNIIFNCQSTKFNVEEKLFSMVVVMDDASLSISLREQNPKEALIQIKNNTKDLDFVILQEGFENAYSIKPTETLPFAWTQPSAKNVISASVSKDDQNSTWFNCTLGEINKSKSVF